MYHRKAQHLIIRFTDNRAMDQVFVRARLTLHESWLEVQGWQVKCEHETKTSWKKGRKGVIVSKEMHRIYPEAAVLFVNIDEEKIDMRRYKKE